MNNQIAVRVLRSVAVSDDGIRTREIVKGTDDFVPASTFDGLMSEGYVVAIDAPREPAANGATSPPAGDQPDAPGDVPDLESMKAADIKAFAEQKGIDVSALRTKAEAVAAIRAALATPQ